MENKAMILLVLSVLLLASCDTFGPRKPIEDIDYNVGREGVTIELMEKAPPVSIYENSQFSARVHIKNNGAAHLPLNTSELENSELPDFIPGRITLSYDTFYINVDPDLSRINPNLEDDKRNITVLGRSDIVPEGEEKTMTVGYFKARNVTGQRESPDTQLYASICYPYRTTLSTDVCMDSTQQQENLREQVCSARDLSFPKGQGAPVTITNVEVDMVPLGQITRPSFVVHIENTGSGSVLRALDSYENIEEMCSFRSTDRRTQGTVLAQADIAGIELECRPQRVKLAGDTNTFHCIVPSAALGNNPDLFGRQDNFVTSLNVDLWYYYVSSDSKTIEIKRTTGNLLGDQLEEQTGECPPWQTEKDGRCVNKCGEEHEDMSCSCGTADIQELPPSRYNLGDLCAPGIVCCQKTACSDFGSERSCTDGDGEALGCNWCDNKDECVPSCDACDLDDPVLEDGVCMEREVDDGQ